MLRAKFLSLISDDHLIRTSRVVLQLQVLRAGYVDCVKNLLTGSNSAATNTANATRWLV